MMLSWLPMFNQLPVGLKSRVSRSHLLQKLSSTKILRRLSISQKIGYGYTVTVGVAMISTAVGFILGETYYFQATQRATLAHQKGELLRDLENTVNTARNHSLRLVYLIGNEEGLKNEVNQFTLQTERAQFLILQTQSFLARNHQVFTVNHNLTEVLKQYHQLLKYYQQLVELELRELNLLDVKPYDLSMKQLQLLRVASGHSDYLLKDLSEDVKQQILIAQQFEHEATVVLQQVQMFRMVIIVGTLVFSSLIAITLAVYTSRGIARPLEQVTHVAQQVAQESNFALRVPVITEDEVGVLAHSFNHLIQRMADYTLELQETQTQLIQNEKMSSLGQMVAGVAHEINNPLNFIAANVDYIERYCSDLMTLISLYQQHYTEPHHVIHHYLEEIEFDFMQQDIQKIVDSMKTGSNRIHHLVLSLRNFSRLDQSDEKLIDIHQGIEDTLVILSHRLKKGIEVNKDYRTLVKIECYPALLNQVFMNLIINAIDALELRLKDINLEAPTIWIQTQSLGQDQIEIRIRDNGPGIDPAIQAKIFDPFFTTKPIGKGTGLGMAISHQIIAKHQGKIYLNSDYKTGVEFVIILPVKLSSIS